MSNNKKLDMAYFTLISDLKLILNESRLMTDKTRKKISENDLEIEEFQELLATERENGEMSSENIKIYNKLNKQGYESHRTMQLSLNANFVHCFALFEIFVQKAVEINFKKKSSSKNSPKSIYKQEFLKFANDRSKKQDLSLNHMLIDEEKMLSHYGKLPNKMLLWTRMFGIKKEGLYKNIIFRYNEARERRNLLVHRGIYSDNTYIKSFVEIHKGADNGEKAKKFIDRTLKNYSFQTKKDKELNRFNIQVMPRYLIVVFRMLFSMASIIYLASFKLSKKDIDDDISIFPNGLMHALMMFSREMNSIQFIFPLLDILDDYKKSMAKDSWKNISNMDKFNYLICKKYIIDDWYKMTRKLKNDKKINTRQKNELITMVEKDIKKSEEILLLDKSSISKIVDSNNIGFKLASYHIENNIEAIITCIKKNAVALKKDYGSSFLEDWFMFKGLKYQKDKKFKQLIIDFKLM